MQATSAGGRRRSRTRERQVDLEGTRVLQAHTGPAPWFGLVPEDGWLMLLLTAMLVYVTVWSIQSVTPPWAPGLGILSTVTTAGLLLAYLSIQQGRLPGSLVHTVALAVGVVFAFEQTAEASLGGDRGALLSHLGVWFHSVLASGSSNDNAIFLLFLAILTTLLAYISLWLVLRTRRPWLAVLANGIVLLINLNWTTADHDIFLALFLLVTLLLLVRFNLAENMRDWRAKGLRFSPDLSWDFMQAGALFSVLVLLLAYNLPVGTSNPAIANALGSSHSPLTALQSRLAQLFGGLSGTKGSGPGVAFFGNSLKLVGTVNLPTTVVLHYKVPDFNDDYTQYLVTESFDTYGNLGTWTQSATQQAHYDAGIQEPAPSGATTLDTYSITFDQTPAGGQSFLFAPGAVPAQFSVPADAQDSIVSNTPVNWQASHPISAGQTYNAEGYVPTASVAQLESVPYPPAAGSASSNLAFPPSILQEYLPSDSSYIAPQVVQAAKQATEGAHNMYDAAQDIENYLRTFTYSTSNANPPANEDAVAWFLSTQKGYCTFFASALALMGRALGIPTRIVSGFINGTYDPTQNDFVVRGTSAHTWTQIYFGRQYGWINFEPTQTFNQFARGLSTVPLPSTSPTPQGGTPGATATSTRPRRIPRTWALAAVAPIQSAARHSSIRDWAWLP